MMTRRAWGGEEEGEGRTNPNTDGCAEFYKCLLITGTQELLLSDSPDRTSFIQQSTGPGQQAGQVG